ncbi:MAG: hypothetical protein ACO3XJ_05080 [Candidatus Nanopelagicales bacterium]
MRKMEVHLALGPVKRQSAVFAFVVHNRNIPHLLDFKTTADRATRHQVFVRHNPKIGN